MRRASFLSLARPAPPPLTADLRRRREHPRRYDKTAPLRARENVTTVRCDPGRPGCGPPLKPDALYASPPRTSFQARCRQRPATDLQHVTRVYKPEVVER